MTVRISHVPARQLVVVAVDGKPPITTFLGASRRAMRFDSYRGEIGVIMDLRAQTGSELTAGKLSGFLGRFDRVLGMVGSHVTFAIVAEPGQFGYGMARMFLALADTAKNITVRIFETDAETEEWAGFRGILRLEPHLTIPDFRIFRQGYGHMPQSPQHWYCMKYGTGPGCPVTCNIRETCVKGLMKASSQSIWAS